MLLLRNVIGVWWRRWKAVSDWSKMRDTVDRSELWAVVDGNSLESVMRWWRWRSVVSHMRWSWWTERLSQSNSVLRHA